MLIRKIHPADAPAISKLSEQLGYAISKEQTATQIQSINASANDIAYIAVDADKIIAWIHVFYTVRIETLPFCEIAGLVVDEQYRGKGIGKMLIESTKSWCKSKNCKVIRVRSNIKRADAHIFYERAGFKELKQQKVFEINL